ncbi:MAG: aminotransferase class I/II-fold pyridoxal phosphate-dependent enzyme [Bacteroidetes bacterium]|nr:aminotransferase class I/II-fold pyridoxal phosphate-dependent enzyme [Bacteroidota bacterium]
MKNLDTVVIHSGDEFNVTGAVVPPVWQSVNYKTKDLLTMAKISVEDRPLGFYARYATPTLKQLSRVCADLEKTEDSVAFGSGMAAISSAIACTLKSGDHIVAQSNLYATTIKYLRDVLPAFGITTTFVDQTDNKAFEKAVRKSTKLIYVETPSNPLMKITDLEFIGRLCKKKKIISLIDNTFASPINQNPADFGIDVIIHSATKYLGGHSDVLAGVVCGSKEFIYKCWDYGHVVGHVLAPHDASLLLRSIKTLPMRVKKQNENALLIAQYLEEHLKVKKVYHPGLISHAQYGLAASQMRGFGGCFSFELDCTYKKAVQFVEVLKLCKLAVSLGGVETVVTLPAAQWKPFYTQKQLAATGISESLIRLAVGIENHEDIIKDLERGFRKL